MAGVLGMILAGGGEGSRLRPFNGYAYEACCAIWRQLPPDRFCIK